MEAEEVGQAGYKHQGADDLMASLVAEYSAGEAKQETPAPEVGEAQNRAQDALESQAEPGEGQGQENEDD